MIKINKPKAIPEILQTKGKTENNKNCANYIIDPQSIFDIKRNIYGDPSVKSKLRNAQGGENGKGGKCCYCEMDQSGQDGAVEHFRPKKGYKSTKNQELKKPGYYWLGYDWSNLFFVCSHCNNRKLNLFPLLDESKRAKSHLDNLNNETPLLLDPAGRKDPRKHITFEGQFPKGSTKYGKKTIEICGLDRDELNTMRMKLIADIDFKIMVIQEFSSDSQKNHIVDKAKEYLKDSMKVDAKFSATAIDYLSTFNITS